MKLIKIILGSVLALVIVAVLVLGYLGFIPGLSHIFGSDKARDLGVRTTSESLGSASKKIMLAAVTGSVFNGSAPGTPVSLAGSHSVDVNLSSEEITSLLQEMFYNLNQIAQDLQIKINSNGTVEASGILNFQKLNQFISDPRLDEVIKYAKKYQIFGSTAIFYISGSGSVTNNQASVNISQVQIGRVNVPIKNDMNQVADTLVQRNIRNVPGFSIDSASFNNGQLHLVGQLPNSLKLIK